ncbi:hypothetical protein L0F63_000570 [Massospora cicadina]|nr:hypothetical protein L0F63_000570 [Massospora cicadina]
MEFCHNSEADDKSDNLTEFHNEKINIVRPNGSVTSSFHEASSQILHQEKRLLDDSVSRSSPHYEKEWLYFQKGSKLATEAAHSAFYLRGLIANL